MCRVLSYLGPRAQLARFLFASDNGLVRQSYEPQLLEVLNLGGFGMVAWDEHGCDPQIPLSYRSTDLPIFDQNLRSIADKFESTCFLAHVRGIAYRADSGFGAHNLHPFRFEGQRWAMAHNGDLSHHRSIKHALLRDVPAELRAQIQGTTDSETVYAMVLSELDEDDDSGALVEAIRRTLRRIGEVRGDHGIDESSSLNLFFSDGRAIVGLRYCFDFGNYPLSGEPDFNRSAHRYLSLWYTVGDEFTEQDGTWQMSGAPDSNRAVLVASEPLSRDITGWVEVPEYTFLVADPNRGAPTMVEV